MNTMSEYLESHARGTADTQAGEALTELIAAVMGHESATAKGSLVLTLAVSRAGDAQVKIEVSTTVKTPKGKSTVETLWADEGGATSREAPRPEPTPIEDLAARRAANSRKEHTS